ncbi:MAG: CotH kinase family protein [Sediminibacterium sp.]|nr:CotH kinase family protein [Sediminibacterium sp.]
MKLVKKISVKIHSTKTYVRVLLFLLVVNTLSAQVVINEYSTSNLSVFTDNFGSAEDFIELYNTSAAPVNLSGYRLSDKANNPGKFTFGNVTINGNSYLRIWASGRGINTGANLHTNFNLKQCNGDKIIFSSPAFVILDSLTLRRTQLGHSRGRTTDGATTWSLFTTPTPNASNNTSTPYLSYAPTPTLSVGPGFYTSAQTVSLPNLGPGFTVRYTTNGSTPNPASTLYTAPIAVPTTSVIRARAFSTNTLILPSFVESNTYFINVNHSIEVVSIFADNITNLMAGSVVVPQTGLEYFDANGVFKTEAFGQTNKHGNDSWAYPQRGIDFIARDEFGYSDAIKHKIFNSKSRNKFQRLIIKAAANDNYPFEGNSTPTNLGGAHIRDAYVHTVSQKSKLHLDERTWAPAILYVNGRYWGVYDLREKVDDDDFTEFYHNTKKDSLQFLQTWGGTWAAYGGPQAPTDWATLRNFITSNSMVNPANYNYVSSVFDTQSLADYVILNSYVVSMDWLNWNTAWWRGINYQASKKKWRYTLWDCDATFSHYINYTNIPNTSYNANPCDPQSLNNPGNQGHIPILNALMTNPTFKQYYVMRYFDLLNTGLSCTRMIQVLDSMILKITPEMPRQITRWGGTMGAWQQNVTDLRNFILKRCDSVKTGFNGCYNVTGPYKITVKTVPANAGFVAFNSLTLTTFPWVGSYPGTLPNLATALPNPNYCFTHWTTSSGVILPNTAVPSISLTLTANDTLTAHFAINQTLTAVPASTTICSGKSVQLEVQDGFEYAWTPTIGLSCTTCSNPIASPLVSTVYSVSPHACTGVKQITVNVVQSPNLQLTASTLTLCLSKTFTSQIVATGAQSYSWVPHNSINSLNQNQIIVSPTVSTTYTVNGVNSQGALDCPEQARITIVVAPQIIAGVNPNVAICKGEKASFTAYGGTNYNWSPPDGLNTTTLSSVVSSATSGMVYTVNVSKPGYCSDIATTTLTVHDLPKVNAGKDTTYNIDDKIILTAEGTGSIAWIGGEDIACKDCPQTQIYPKRDACYIAEATNEFGCKVSDQVCIVVTKNWGIYIPNSFTPNGDGLNDVFQIYGNSLLEIKMDIYDRWGQLLFTSNNIENSWDGTFKNVPCEVGIYNYRIVYKGVDNKSNEKTGSITLIR